MARGRRTTDFGTVLLHAALVVSFLVLAGTGLRIGSDDPDAEWLRLLDPVLPVDHLWYRHMVAGVALAAIMAAYVCYLTGARLQSRVRLDKARALTILRPGRQRWASLNVLVYWILMAALLIEIASGIVLFSGSGQPFLGLHLAAGLLSIGCVLVHIGLHAAAGGLSQLVRVVRPSILHIAPPPPDIAELLAEQLAKSSARPAARPSTLKAHPLATAAAVGLSIAAIAVGAERGTRQTLRVTEVSRLSAPVLNGELSDPAWSLARPVTLLTTQGGDFGGTHQAEVEIRAVHDGEFAYFSFVWDDPTRSLKHQPLIKRDGHWYEAAATDGTDDEDEFYEDKFAVLLTRPVLPLIGAAIHLARQPLPDKPASGSGRGLHYTVGGTIADVWQWRASHAGATGHIDDCHFGGPAQPTDPKAAWGSVYTGGFQLDAGGLPYQSNGVVEPGTPGGPTIRPRRLPRDLGAIAKVMGRISGAVSESEGETARWWMLVSESEPYSAERDAAVPDGTVIPSVVFADDPARPRDRVRGVARWAAGRWTLELARRLYTGSDEDTPIKTGTMLWVAAFDHAETRHTRHLRPLTLKVD